MEDEGERQLLSCKCSCVQGYFVCPFGDKVASCLCLCLLPVVTCGQWTLAKVHTQGNSGQSVFEYPKVKATVMYPGDKRQRVCHAVEQRKG